jgi:MFS family permease
MQADRKGLGRHADFLRLWAGTALVDAGAAVTNLALPLVAIVTLAAGPAQIGVLIALRQAPIPLFGLFAGVWIDRRPRRPLMVAARLGHALLLASLPLAAAADVLRIELLYGVSFGLGVFALVFDLAATSYLPSLVEPNQLVSANSRLLLTGGVSRVAGPGLGGLAVQLIGAPLTLVIDVLGSIAAAFGLLRIRRPESARAQRSGRASFVREIGEGLRGAFAHPVVAAIIVCSTIGSFANAVQQAVFLLFLTRELEMSPALLGGIVAVAGGASLLAALAARVLAERFGPGPAMVGATVLWLAGAALLPLASPGTGSTLPLLLAAQLCLGFAHTLYSIHQISLRQALVPPALLGRVNATRRVLVFGAIPLGALAGGALGEAFGLRAALWTSAGLASAWFVYAAASPLRSARSIELLDL